MFPFSPDPEPRDLIRKPLKRLNLQKLYPSESLGALSLQSVYFSSYCQYINWRLIDGAQTASCISLSVSVSLLEMVHAAALSLLADLFQLI